MYMRSLLLLYHLRAVNLLPNLAKQNGQIIEPGTRHSKSQPSGSGKAASTVLCVDLFGHSSCPQVVTE